MRLARLFGWIVAALFVLLQWLPHVPYSNAVPDKLAHAGIYFVFGLLLWSLLPVDDPNAHAAATVALGLLLGILMESGQPAFGRDADPWDIVADLQGLAMAGTALAVGGNLHEPVTHDR